MLSKNHVYKNVEAQKCPFLKNIVVISLVAEEVSPSFELAQSNGKLITFGSVVKRD